MENKKNFLDVIKTRRSVRNYTTKEISKEILIDLIDCARFAPSGRNEQPWEFIIITNKSTLKKIAELTDNGKFIENASAGIVVLCKDTKYYIEDGSAATQNILLAAWTYGIGSCWIAGDKKFYAKDICKLLEVPEGYKLLSIVSLGYPNGEIPQKNKRKLEHVLHWEKW